MIAEVKSYNPSNVVLVKDSSRVEIASFGIQGPRGNSMLSGFGLPSIGLGENLDLYIDLNSGHIYRKEIGVWVFRVSTVPQTKVYTITEEQISSKQIILDMAPIAPTSVSLRFLNGTAQVYGEQYIVQGSILSWDGYSLDGFIEVGDIISIGY